MAWDDDYPYAFMLNPDDIQPRGLNIELALAVFAESKCQLRFLKMPWARALVELSQGRIDIIGGAYSNQERQQYARYSKISFHFENLLFIRTDISNNVVLSTLSDIQKNQLKIGVQIDVYYGDAFETLKLNSDFSRLIYPNTSRKALWGMLSLGRIDGVIADARSGQNELKRLGLSSVIVPSGLIIYDQASH
ncbi:MAG: transporter substrate-binding domain-containing protein, partial [Gilvibacter sp.]